MRDESLDIRKEIETLAIWYIPVYAGLVIASVFMTDYFREIASGGISNLQKSTFFLFSYASKVIGLSDNLVVAIWLFAQGKRDGGRKVLWFLFGLVAHLFAAVIYLALKLLEQQRASSGLLKADK